MFQSMFTLPSRHMHAEWNKLTRIKKMDDELYRYSNAKRYWGMLAGRGRYMLVRKGALIADIMTEMN